jgi:predicted transcriptional regulator
MPTTKQRINIVLPEELKSALMRIAKRDRVPEAATARRLIESALETEEDGVWDDRAGKREKKRAQFVSHQKAWR